jgi:tripartite-type tricarboxylate transporter receptor subunit TctC
MESGQKWPHRGVARINRDVVKALQSLEVRERLASLGAEPMPMASDKFDAYIREEYVANAKIVKAAGMQAN